MYELIIAVCADAASYGKAVRSCWPGIKTRRLGVRGQSRYHFCGVRPSNKMIQDMLAVADAELFAAAAAAAATATSSSAAGESGEEGNSTYVAADPHQHQEQSRASVMLSMPNLLNPRKSTSPNSAGSAYTSPVEQAPASFGKERMESYDSYQGSESSVNMHGYNPDDSGYGSTYLPIVQVQYGPPGSEAAPSSSGLRRQASAPSLMHVPSSNDGSQGGGAVGDFSFPDLKTPTAPAFLQHQYPQQQSASAVLFGSSMQNVLQKFKSDPQGLGIGLPQDAAAVAYLKGRRATESNLQITIPELHGGPTSAHPLRPTDHQAGQHPLTIASETDGLPTVASAEKSRISLQLPSFEEVLAEVYTISGGPHGLQHAHSLQVTLKTLDKSAAVYLWNTYKTEHCLVLTRLFSACRYAEVSWRVRTNLSKTQIVICSLDTQPLSFGQASHLIMQGSYSTRS